MALPTVNKTKKEKKSLPMYKAFLDPDLKI